MDRHDELGDEFTEREIASGTAAFTGMGLAIAGVVFVGIDFQSIWWWAAVCTVAAFVAGDLSKVVFRRVA